MYPPLASEIHLAASITQDVLKQAASFFSSEYGIWGPQAEEKMGKFCKPGQRVKMSADRLRQQSVKLGTDSVMVRCLHDGVLVGHAFATRWVVDGKSACWVTQLCVRAQYRRRGVATTMLRSLKNHDNAYYGIMSSHPAAIMAALRAFGHGIECVSFDFIREHAGNVIAASPVEYIRGAILKGALFDREQSECSAEEGASVCCADTRFWVDHAEPMAVLATVKKEHGFWPFGDLLEGCEWLVLVGNGKSEN